jgi:cytochrome c biogenesis protein CcmG/thiol:disulfide interchange protein DsbE
MTKRQWTLTAGLAGAAVVIAAFTVGVLPQIELVGPGSRAPDFHAVNLATGRASSLADYRGRVLLLNIWATWCEPCRVEMPAIERLYNDFEGSDFRLISVSIDQDDPGVVRDYARTLGLTFQILQDRSTKIRYTYQATGYPESFVINRQGVIVKKVIGAARWDDPVNELLIRRLLNER